MVTTLTFTSIRNAINALCDKDPAIVAAYIFGSAAKADASRCNDVDVALLVDESGLESFDLLSFMSSLEKKLGCPVDVVVLNRAGEVLKYEVRRSSQLVFERSRELRKRFEIKGRKTYEDFLHLHRRYTEAVLYGGDNG